ncbi:hypothetical protein, partial [Glycomyces sp. MUSA5-2]|uniref:hypothetical protein n=1 Tax=Glycomyces sp. MUSA5-2 TaxID=2053002 RepID=UPI00300AB6CF
VPCQVLACCDPRFLGPRSPSASLDENLPCFKDCGEKGCHDLNMSATSDEVEHLAFIKYLHQLGVEQARLSYPMASVSILLFHDAVESFLRLAAKRFSLTPPNDFMEYWDKLGKKLPGATVLPNKPGMFQLNKHRVNLKHHGIQPSPRDIGSAVTEVAAFFAGATQTVFGEDYETVSLVDIISQAEVKTFAEKAEDLASAGNIVAAMTYLRRAFDELFNPDRPGSGLRTGSPLAFDLSSLSQLREKAFAASRSLEAPDPSEAEERLKDVLNELAQLGSALRPLRLGVMFAALAIDFGEFLRFDRLVPIPEGPYDDGTIHWLAGTGYAPDRDEFNFCLQFVVTAALRMAAAEGHAADPAWLVREDDGRVHLHVFYSDRPETDETEPDIA